MLHIYHLPFRIMIGEALQSKDLETTHWGTYPQYVNSLQQQDLNEYFRLQYEKLELDTQKNSLSSKKDSLF